jgi:small multidrug resistance pump
MAFLYLLIAILAEVIATSAMKASDGFSQLLPSGITILGYALRSTFYL